MFLAFCVLWFLSVGCVISHGMYIEYLAAVKRWRRTDLSPEARKLLKRAGYPINILNEEFYRTKA